VICRLVQQEDVRIVEQEPRKTEPRALAARERCHLPLAQGLEPEAPEDSPYGCLEVISTAVLELMLSFGVPLQELLVSSPQTRLELVHLGLEFPQVRRRAARVLVDGAGRLEEDLLLHKANARAASERDISSVGRVEPCSDAQQRGLPHSVRPDQTDAVPVSEPERHVAEHEALAETLRDRLDRKNTHPRGARWQRGQWNVPRPPTTVRTIARPQRGHGSPARA